MTNETEPRIYTHAVNLYNTIEKKAIGGRYEGSLTFAYAEIGASQALYSQLYGALYEMGSLTLVTRGRRNQQSVVEVHHPPTLDDFRNVYKKVLTRSTGSDILQQRIENLERRIEGIDIRSAFVNVEERLTSLEERSNIPHGT